MTRQKGIWLDSKKAVIVSFSVDNSKFETIESGIESRERESGEGRKFGRFAKQFLSFEKSKQRKTRRQEKEYFKKIIQSLGRAEEVVLFGPASTKKRLEKEIESIKSLNFKVDGDHDSDSMTDNQIVAWVKDYFISKK